ncbi:hypothetical protein [Brevundimonas sp.]|jgi:hypothetical protein|uniref:hypothetical protein n=1 Tax=Brevundimonas sp. TaxID=1871086 RepID=UPI0037BEEA06
MSLTWTVAPACASANWSQRPGAGVRIPNAEYASKPPYVTLVDAAWQRTMLELDGLDPSRSLSD